MLETMGRNRRFPQMFKLKKLISSYQPQPAFTCSKLTIETVEQGKKYDQS